MKALTITADWDVPSMSMVLGNVWRFLSKPERQVFYEQADIQRERFREYRTQLRAQTEQDKLEQPKRPLNPFILYCQDHMRRTTQPLGHSLSRQQSLKECARRWRGLKLSLKRVYRQRAEQGKLDYLARKRGLEKASVPRPFLEWHPPTITEGQAIRGQSESTDVTKELGFPEVRTDGPFSFPTVTTQSEFTMPEVTSPSDLPAQVNAEGHFPVQVVTEPRVVTKGKLISPEFMLEGELSFPNVFTESRPALPAAMPDGAYSEGEKTVAAIARHKGLHMRIGKNNNKKFTDSSDTDSATQLQTDGQQVAAEAAVDQIQPHRMCLGLQCHRLVRPMTAKRAHLWASAAAAKTAKRRRGLEAPAPALAAGTGRSSQRAGESESSDSSPSVIRDKSSHNIAGEDRSLGCASPSNSYDSDSAEGTSGKPRKRDKHKRKKKRRRHSSNVLDKRVHWQDEASRWGPCAVSDPVTSALCDEDIVHSLFCAQPLASNNLSGLRSSSYTDVPSFSLEPPFKRSESCSFLPVFNDPGSLLSWLYSPSRAASRGNQASPSIRSALSNPLDTRGPSNGQVETSGALGLLGQNSAFSPLISNPYVSSLSCVSRYNPAFSFPEDSRLSSLQSARRSRSCESVESGRDRVQAAVLRSHLNRLQSTLTDISISSSSSSSQLQRLGLCLTNNCLARGLVSEPDSRQDPVCRKVDSTHGAQPELTGARCVFPVETVRCDDFRTARAKKKEIERGTNSHSKKVSFAIDKITPHLSMVSSFEGWPDWISSSGSKTSPFQRSMDSNKQIPNAVDTIPSPLLSPLSSGDRLDIDHLEAGSCKDIESGQTTNRGACTKVSVGNAIAAGDFPHGSHQRPFFASQSTCDADLEANTSAFTRIICGNRPQRGAVCPTAKGGYHKQSKNNCYSFHPIKDPNDNHRHSLSAKYDPILMSSDEHARMTGKSSLLSADCSRLSFNSGGNFRDLDKQFVPRAIGLDADETDEDLCFSVDRCILDFLKDLAHCHHPSFSYTSQSGRNALSKLDIELDCMLETPDCLDSTVAPDLHPLIVSDLCPRFISSSDKTAGDADTSTAHCLADSSPTPNNNNNNSPKRPSASVTIGNERSGRRKCRTAL